MYVDGGCTDGLCENEPGCASVPGTVTDPLQDSWPDQQSLGHLFENLSKKTKSIGGKKVSFPWTPRSENKGKEVFPGTRADIPLQPMDVLEEITVEQVIPWSPCRGLHQNRYPHCNPWRIPYWWEELMDIAWALQLWRAHARAGFCVRNCSPHRVRTLEQRKSLRKELLRQCCRLTATPVSPMLLGERGGGRVGNDVVKLSLGKKGVRWRERCFSFFVSHNPTQH